jgi:hypothetical protein
LHPFFFIFLSSFLHYCLDRIQLFVVDPVSTRRLGGRLSSTRAYIGVIQSGFRVIEFLTAFCAIENLVLLEMVTVIAISELNHERAKSISGFT